MTPIFHISNPA